MYGAEIRSNVDDSVLLSSDMYAQVCVSASYPVSASPDNLVSYFAYYFVSSIASKRPIVFVELNTYLARPMRLFWDSGNSTWVLSLLFNMYNPTVMEDFPKVFAFHDIRDISYTSSGYGLELYDENGVITYSSETALPVLQVKEIVALNYTCNFGVTAGTYIPELVSRPAVIFHTAFFGLDYISGSGPYVLSHTVSGLLKNGAHDIVCATINFNGFLHATHYDNYVIHADTRFADTAIISGADYD